MGICFVRQTREVCLQDNLAERGKGKYLQRSSIRKDPNKQEKSELVRLEQKVRSKENDLKGGWGGWTSRRHHSIAEDFVYLLASNKGKLMKSFQQKKAFAVLPSRMLTLGLGQGNNDVLVFIAKQLPSLPDQLSLLTAVHHRPGLWTISMNS